MKKTIAIFLAAVLLLTVPLPALAASSGDPDYDALYGLVAGYAKSIDESAKLLRAGSPDYDFSSYDKVSGVVDMINSGKLEVMGYQVDIADPQAVKLALGSLETELVSQEKVRELATSALTAAASMLAPVAAQMELDALASQPLSTESLTARADAYGKQSAELLARLRKFINENDMSAVLTEENVSQVLVSLIADPEGEMTMKLFSMLAGGLGPAKALEAGLLFSEISAMTTRFKLLQADAQEWAKTGGSAVDAQNIADTFVSQVVGELLALMKQPIIK